MKPSSRVKLVAAMFCLQLIGCEDGRVSTTNDSSRLSQEKAGGKVKYSENSAFEYDVQNFSNADWLFEQYFGQYGVPDEMKPAVEKDLRLLANGFALQFAKGEDVQAAMQKLDGFATLSAISGSLQLTGQSFKGDPELGPISPLQAPLDEPPEDWVEQIPITNETLLALAEADKEVEELKQSQLDDVAKYGLPYVIEDSNVQYYTIDRLMDKDDDGGSTSTPSKPSFGDIAGTTDFWHGDIMWSDASKGYVNHVGLISTASTRYYVIDAAPGNPNGGVYLHTTGVNRWADDCKDCTRLEMLTHSRAPYYLPETHTFRTKAVNYALAQVGDPYSYNFADRNSTSAFYCSKLVWQAWRHAGFDLAPQTHLAVTPNDIRFGNHVHRTASWTR